MVNYLEQAINALVADSHHAAVDAGWWSEKGGNPTDPNARGITAEKLALIHSEVSEALEGYRKDEMDHHLPHRKAFEVELADALIRIFDLAGAHGLDVGGAYVEKGAYNVDRLDHKAEARNAPGGKKKKNSDVFSKSKTY